jgi:hypothetical protein
MEGDEPWAGRHIQQALDVRQQLVARVLTGRQQQQQHQQAGVAVNRCCSAVDRCCSTQKLYKMHPHHQQRQQHLPHCCHLQQRHRHLLLLVLPEGS